MYAIRLLDAAERDLAHLDRPVARRIVERLSWLAEHWDEVKPEVLAGDLSAFCRLRVGDYRVIYEILSAERVLMVHAIGHRREVYRSR